MVRVLGSFHSMNARVLSLMALAMISTACLNGDDLAGKSRQGSEPSRAPSATPTPTATPDQFVFAGVESGAAVAHDKVTLRFAPATGSSVVIYRVYRDGNFITPILSTSAPIADQTGKLNVTITGLDINTQYTFLIRAFNGFAEETNTKTVNVTTLSFYVPDFAGVTNFVAPAGLAGQTSATATWSPATVTAPATLAGYNIYFATGNNAIDFSAPQQVAPSGDTSITFSGLNPGSKYSVAVRAKDSNGRLDTNTIVKTVITNTSQPLSFIGLQTAIPGPGIQGFTSVDLSWIGAVGDFNHYKVYVSTSSPAGLPNNDPFWASPLAVINDTTRTGYTVTALTPRTTYYFVVRAGNSVAGTDDGNKIVRTVSTNPPTPSFSGATGVTQPGGVAGLTSLTISWSPASGAFNRYYVYKKSGGVYNYAAPDATTSPPGTSLTIGGLTTGTSYCFQVRAVYDGVAPIHSDSNTVEVCATPTYTAPSFAGIASCTPAPGSTAVSMNLTWAAGSGIFDQYLVWVSTTGVVDFNSAPTLILPDGLTTYTVPNLQPNQAYTFGVRTKYSVNSATDSNLSTATCSTSPGYLVFTQTTNGVKDVLNKFLTNTTACIRDASGNNIPITSNITIAKVLGGGTLGGTLTKTPVNGCASFSDLTYTGADTMTLRVTNANATNATTAPISVSGVAVTPPGACQINDANWVTGYGGCYSPGLGLVVSSRSGGTIPAVLSVWEAKADRSDVELTDTADGDGDLVPDEIDATSPFKVALGNPGYCHDLIEGGYSDWRAPKYTDFSNITTITGYTNHLSFNVTPGAEYYWSSTQQQTPGAYQGLHHFSGITYAGAGSSYRMFCVRTPETTYTPPVFSGLSSVVIPAGASGAGAVDLNWTTASGSYTGYYIYWSPVGTPIDFNVAPQAKLAKPATSYRVTGLLPGVNYEFAVRAVFSNREPAESDGNTVKLTQVTRSAHLEWTVFTGQPMPSGNIPVIVRVIDDVSGAVYPTNITISLTQIGGTGSLTGTLATNATSGVAKFTGLTFNDYSGTATLQISAGSSYTPTINSTLKTITPAYNTGCTNFSATVYPDHGGCYFKNPDIIIHAGGLTAYYTGWGTIQYEAPPGHVSLEAEDTVDHDGDGNKDDFDPTAAANMLGTVTAPCHALSAGGKTDWQMPTRAQLNALNSESPWTYAPIVTGTSTYMSSYTDAAGTGSMVYTFSPTASGESWIVNSWSNYFCVRKNP